MIDRNKYYLKGEMRSRGWNQVMLDEFGLEPDKYATNPRYKRAFPSQYYLKSKVHAIEGTFEFQQRLAKKRKAGAKLSEAMKRAEEERRRQSLQHYLTGDFPPGSFSSYAQEYLRKKHNYDPDKSPDLQV